MGVQLSLDLQGRAQVGATPRIWILAVETGEISLDHRHLIVDAFDATPLAAPGDVMLVRQGPGKYAVLGPEKLDARARAELIGQLATLLTRPTTAPRRVTEIAEALDIALTRGRFRGTLVGMLEDVRARTSFEHALCSLAARHDGGAFEPALQAAHLAERVPEEATHPIVMGIFRREHGDMLSELYSETSDEFFLRTAVPTYLSAARSFESLGLRHQARAARHRADRLQSSVDEPWLPGLPMPPRATASSLGYSLRRACGFAIEVPTGAALPTTQGDTGVPFVWLGDLAVDEAEILAMLAVVPSPRRRIVAVVQEADGEMVVRVGLSGEMQAYFGLLPEDVDYSEVIAIELESERTELRGHQHAFRPSGPVTFVAKPRGSSHDLSVRVAMRRDDDLMLNFHVKKPTQLPQAYF